MIGPLHIAAIRKSLLNVKENFPVINQHLTDRRDPLTNEVIANMVDGYNALNGYIAVGTNPFVLGQSACMLELNQIILCGHSNRSAESTLSLHKKLRQASVATAHESLSVSHETHDDHTNAASRYFYGDDGCVREFMEWFEVNSNKSVWLQAAGLLGQILSYPQLFLEGNHRTATLLMSYLLVSHGKPPYVLKPETAHNFFEYASVFKNKKKRGFDTLLSLPHLTERFANHLAAESDGSFLL
jgi:hypothetical protein